MMSSTGSTKKIELLHYSKLDCFPDLTHFTTTRVGGVSTDNYASFNLSEYSGDRFDSVQENRQILCREIEISPDKLFIPYQTHEEHIAIIDNAFLQLSSAEQQERLRGVDSLITNAPNCCIGVTTADCIPILLYDPIQRIAAVVHAGWRGTVKRIAGKTVASMVAQFNCNPNDIVAVIGPSIGPVAFEVGDEVVMEFEKAGFTSSILTHFDKPHINLWEANAQDLVESGLMRTNIEIAEICTFTQHERFFSARRLGILSGRCVTGIMLK